MLSARPDLTSLNDDDIQQLDGILQRCDFLQLTSSQAQYPGSQGKGLPLLRVQTSLCSAVIALQGAQLLDFQTTNGEPLLWLSPNCDFSPGVALRGGVPICLPWFGPHPTDATKPKHGFARNQPWQLTHALLVTGGAAELTFRFNSTASSLFAFSFSAELKMTLGHTAKLELTVINTDEKAFDCSYVLHSYYNVSHLNDAVVKGLSGKTYRDKLENYTDKTQVGDVRFPTEVDRVFPGITNNLSIESTPHIAISHHNSPSVVVWNPGAENAAKMADVGAGNEQHYICVERGAVFDEQWHLQAGESQTGWTEFKEV